MDIVLVHPQIPQNTGSIARTCAATQTPLHLIEPLGFALTEKAVRRAGLDYWPWVPLSRHRSWEEYLAARSPRKVWLFTSHGSRNYTEAEFHVDDALVFGSETQGLGMPFLECYPDAQWLKIPMVCPEVRSLNLSNAVAIALYEGRRQLNLDR